MFYVKLQNLNTMIDLIIIGFIAACSGTGIIVGKAAEKAVDKWCEGDDKDVDLDDDD